MAVLRTASLAVQRHWQDKGQPLTAPKATCTQPLLCFCLSLSQAVCINAETYTMCTLTPAALLPQLPQLLWGPQTVCTNLTTLGANKRTVFHSICQFIISEHRRHPHDPCVNFQRCGGPTLRPHNCINHSKYCLQQAQALVVPVEPGCMLVSHT